MRILQVHNFYQVKGGEDSVVFQEKNLLFINGHEVDTYYVYNDQIKGFFGKLNSAFSLFYSFKSAREISKKITHFHPDIVHVHNTFPLISPSIFKICQKKNIPVVLTLHNYRLICPTATLMFDGKVKLDSVSSFPFWAIKRRVYRGSFFGTAMLSIMIFFYRKSRFWNKYVDRFICLTLFSKNLFSSAGFPEAKLSIKPNFSEEVLDSEAISESDFCLFVGRLSEEKGVNVLLNAWENVDEKLLIIGEGNVTSENKNVHYLGVKNKKTVISYMKKAKCLILPSLWFEGFPMVIVEAFMSATPVVCSKLGSMEEIVENGITGLHFEAGSSLDLSEKVNWLLKHSTECKEMSNNARKKYEKFYSEKVNYEFLLDIYKQAMKEHSEKK